MPPLYRCRKRQDFEMRPVVMLFSGKKIDNSCNLETATSVIQADACSFADP